MDLNTLISQYGYAALVIGYLSASIEWARRKGDPEAWRAWWNDPETPGYYAWIVVRRTQGRLAEPTVEQPSKQPLSCV